MLAIFRVMVWAASPAGIATAKSETVSKAAKRRGREGKFIQSSRGESFQEQVVYLTQVPACPLLVEQDGQLVVGIGLRGDREHLVEHLDEMGLVLSRQVDARGPAQVRPRRL